MPLNDRAVRTAKPHPSKILKMSDGQGLHIEITLKGSKRWRFRYQFAGRAKCISFGIYPDVSLRQARDEREKARRLVAQGIDPSEKRRKDKFKRDEGNRNTFAAVSKAWYDKHKIELSKSRQKRVLSILEQKLCRWIGEKPINQIDVPMLLQALNKICDEGKLPTAKSAKQIAGQVFRFGVTMGLVERDITADLRGALPTPKTKHLAAIIDPKGVGRLMLDIEDYKGSVNVRCALRLAPLTFLRPGELRRGEWKEIDWEQKLWCIGAGKMKASFDHIVPLSCQALEVLHHIHPLTGRGRYIFPNARSSDRPMSDAAVLCALWSMGYARDQMTGHGFRAMARTLIDEELGYRVDWIEQQLAHTVRDALGRAYNRTKHLEGRKEMMQAWADYLDGLKEDARKIRDKTETA